MFIEQKQTVAIDADDVLVNLVDPFCKYLEKKHHIQIKLEDVWSFSFSEVLGLPIPTVVEYFADFYRTAAFADLPPINGAQSSIERLADRFNLVVVTSRPEVLDDGYDIKAITLETIERLYPEKFKAVHFASNAYIPGFAKKNKARICQEIGASVLIDDFPGYLKSCSQIGIKGILFPTNWNKNENEFVRANDWEHVTELIG